MVEIVAIGKAATIRPVSRSMQKLAAASFLVSGTPMIVISNIGMQFRGKPLSFDVSVKFCGGNRCGPIGANRCGKSVAIGCN
jgi:hypothetical protein